jgi:LysR family hydrogen peroxide-inducible transcriptional activator
VGCTLLPQLASLPGAGSLHDDAVLIRPFAPPQPTRTIGLAWRRHFPRQSTLRALAELIRDQLPPEVDVLGDCDLHDACGVSREPVPSEVAAL